MRRAELLAASIAADGGYQDLPTTHLLADGARLLRRDAGHGGALALEMLLHAHIGVLSGPDGDGDVAHRAARRDAVVLGLVVLGARMRVGEKVLLAEGFRAVLALEGEEVDEVACLVVTLLADRQQLLVACAVLGGGHDGDGGKQEDK